VFTPTLFVGASAGALFGTALHQFWVQRGHAGGRVRAGGMGAVLAATTRSPLLAMILIFELSWITRSCRPDAGVRGSILVARQLHGESVYTEHLRVKGLALDRKPAARRDHGTNIGDFMRAPVTPVRENTPLREIADRFLINSNNFCPS